MESIKKRYKEIYLQTRNRLTDLEKEIMVTESGAGRVGGRDSEGVWDRHAHTAIFKMDNQGLPW